MKSCGTCEWFVAPEPSFDLGDCAVPVDESKLPWSYSRSNVESVDGEDCPTYKAKP